MAHFRISLVLRCLCDPWLCDLPKLLWNKYRGAKRQEHYSGGSICYPVEGSKQLNLNIWWQRCLKQKKQPAITNGYNLSWQTVHRTRSQEDKGLPTQDNDKPFAFRSPATNSPSPDAEQSPADPLTLVQQALTALINSQTRHR